MSRARGDQLRLEQQRLARRLVVVATVRSLAQHRVPLVFVELGTQRAAPRLLAIDGNAHPLELRRLAGCGVRLLAALAAHTDVVGPWMYRHVRHRGDAPPTLLLHPGRDDRIERARRLQALRDREGEGADTLLIQAAVVVAELARIELAVAVREAVALEALRIEDDRREPHARLHGEVRRRRAKKVGAG